MNKTTHQPQPLADAAAQKIAALRRTAHDAADAAEKAWYELAGELDVGPDRTRAFEVYVKDAPEAGPTTGHVLYRAVTYSHRTPIEPVMVDRFNGRSVWISGQRRSRHGQYERIFETWDDAHAWLLQRASLAVESAQQRLQAARDGLNFIKGLKK